MILTTVQGVQGEWCKCQWLSDNSVGEKPKKERKNLKKIKKIKTKIKNK